MSNYPHWMHLQEWIIDSGITPGQGFTSRQYAAGTNLSPHEASVRIQAYLEAQRGKKSKTQFVLKKDPGTRTTSTIWTIGSRPYDVEQLKKSFGDDIRNRWYIAIMPDMRRLADINVFIAKDVERQIDTIMNGAMKVIEGALGRL